MEKWFGYGLINHCTLANATNNYIPPQFLKNLNIRKLFSQFTPTSPTCDLEAEALQILMDNSNHQLRIYGSGKELADNIRTYLNFPKSHRIFKSSTHEPFFNMPTFYKSLDSGKSFILKNDALIFIQEFVLRLNFMKYNPLIADFLKHQEMQLDRCCEFVEYDVEEFKEIEKEVRSIMSSPQTKPVLRVFEDEGQRFIMVFDIYTAAAKHEREPFLTDENFEGGLFVICEFDMFLKQVKDDFTEMEYIIVPIQRAKHAAVPILTPQGSHCILAVDVLFEQLRLLIFGVKALQKLKKDQMNVLKKHMKEFMLPLKRRYFFAVPLVKMIQMDILNYWKPFENIPAKDVRNAKKDGFTVDNLKNELINLGLIELFPEITDYAQVVYEDVFRAKKEEFLRTCDLFDAVEQCQLICIFKQFPNLQEFLHTQFACHRMPHLSCAKCEKLKIEKSGNKTTTEVKAEAPRNVPESNLLQKSETALESQEKAPQSLPTVKEEVPQKPKTTLKGEITDSKKTSETKTTSKKKEKDVQNVPDLKSVERAETPSEKEEKALKNLPSAIDRTEKIVTETTKIVQSSINKSVQKPQKEKQKEVAQNAEKESAVPAEKTQNPKSTLETQREITDSTKTYKAKTTSEKKEKAVQNAPELTLVQRSEPAPKTEEKVEKIATKSTKIVQSSTKSVQKQQKTRQKEVAQKAEPADPNESKCCSKCLRTSELCNEAKKELKMAQNKLEKYETKAKRTMEVEKNMKEMEKEIEGMKKIEKQKESVLRIREKEIEELKMKIHKLETAETRWKIRERNLEDDKNTLLRQNSQLESHLKRESLKSETSFQSNRDQQNKLQTTIAAKNKLIDGMQNRINRLLEQNNDKEETISSLIQQIEAPPPTTVVTVVDTVDAPITTIRYQIISLQKIKDSFRHGWQLKYAKDMVERLISLSPESPEIHEFARYEMEQYELKTRDYLQGVEMNLQKIKETQNPLDVIPLPKPPMLSDRFMKEYWVRIDKKMGKMTSSSESTPNPEDVPSVPEGGIVSDTECLICFCEMSPPDEKILECEHCKKVVHFTCAAKWLKIHRSCPHCRREQLDPDEFPKLS